MAYGRFIAKKKGFGYMDFKLEIANRIIKYLDGININDVIPLIETPPNPDMGDYAYPCFKLAKSLKKPPNAIAAELAQSFETDEVIAKVTPMGAYLNFFIDKSLYAREIITAIMKNRHEYGANGYLSGKTFLIDYSSPNIAKPFHVGHIPTTVLGHALYNIFKFLGCNAIGINHLGDWGTQFGKLIVAYNKWGEKSEVDTKGVSELMRLYIKFHDESEKDKELDNEARSWLVKMERGDAEALKLWKWFNDISLNEYINNTYKRLDIQFDYYTGESFYNDKMKAVADELKEKGLLVESDGAMIVDLSAYNMPPCLILRRDGGTLYPTRDIAAALYRKKTYNFDKCLYLTCMDQNLHFAQWMKVIELMGYDWAKDLVHIPLGLINFEEGKLSTRKGNVILLDDLLNDAVKKTREIIEEKNPSLANKDEIAEMVGVGAVVFNNLYNSRIKDVSFSWERVLNFEGESGPYVQYTHARANSILKKGGEITQDDIDYSALTDEHSLEVIKLLGEYPQKIQDAAEKYEPYILSRNLVEICQAFNKFYNNNIVLTGEQNIKNARLSLVFCVKTILGCGLSLLGIKAPEQM